LIVEFLFLAEALDDLIVRVAAPQLFEQSGRAAGM
jgi:hypothetical protein